MASHQKYGTLGTKTGTQVLTTSYGTESAGWTTKGLNVSDYDFITVEYDYGGHDSGASLSMKPMVSDLDAADLDDYRNTETPDSNGALSVDELTFAVTADKIGTFQLDVRGVSMLRIAAKIDDATNDPTLDLRYLGHKAHGPLPRQAPSIS